MAPWEAPKEGDTAREESERERVSVETPSGKHKAQA